METEPCPRCARSTVIDGSILVPGDGLAPHVAFLPAMVRPFFSKPPVRTAGVYRACVSCGLVWSTLDPLALREFIRVQGNELAKQQLDEFDHGPNRGLPESELAREIASKVAEIDALVRSGKPGATGKYRDLKGVTWDQAINDTRNWRDMKRADKLALFGWEPKEKGPVDDLESPDF